MIGYQYVPNNGRFSLKIETKEPDPQITCLNITFSQYQIFIFHIETVSLFFSIIDILFLTKLFA